MTISSQSEVTDQIVSVALVDNKITLTWPDAFRQTLSAVYLRHSPGFPGGDRPAGADGRFPSASEAILPSHAQITDSGDLEIGWQPDGLISLLAGLARFNRILTPMIWRDRWCRVFALIHHNRWRNASVSATGAGVYQPV